jgi:anti-anti-sigma factor
MIEDARRQIELTGEYDLQRREELRGLFDVLDAADVVIDLRNVTYVDSTFLSELIVLRHRLPDSVITLLGPTRSIKRLFEIVDFASIFRIVDE